MAGNLRSLAFLTSFSSCAAPSRRLYSEWTWRWTNSACCTRLLELDGRRRLVGHVVDNGVDAIQRRQGLRDVPDHGLRKARVFGGHPVPRAHGPEHDCLTPGLGAERQHPHREL